MSEQIFGDEKQELGKMLAEMQNSLQSWVESIDAFVNLQQVVQS